MPEPLGIQETLDVIEFVNHLATSLEEAKADGVINIFDAVKLITLIPSATSAVRGSGEIRAEFGDLTGEERDMLLTAFKDAVFKLVGALT